MARLSLRIWHLILVGLMATPLLHVSGPSVAMAQEEDEIMDEEEELEVEDDDEDDDYEPVSVGEDEGDEDYDDDTAVMEDEEEEEEEEALISHPDADTTLIFTNRPNNEFVAGEVVHSLMSLTNNWEKEFVVTGIEASFRYPQDFSYFIQNFSLVYYDSYVMPHSQMSFGYSFTPSESFYARPFGLVVNMYYRDLEGGEYRDAVFNSTVNIVELEEGYDAETFFIYLFMVSGISLLMFCIHYVYSSFRRGDSGVKSKPVETGTQKKDDIDYQWLPEGSIPGTPKKSPRASPRNRKSNKK